MGERVFRHIQKHCAIWRIVKTDQRNSNGVDWASQPLVTGLPLTQSIRVHRLSAYNKANTIGFGGSVSRSLSLSLECATDTETHACQREGCYSNTLKQAKIYFLVPLAGKVVHRHHWFSLFLWFAQNIWQRCDAKRVRTFVYIYSHVCPLFTYPFTFPNRRIWKKNISLQLVVAGLRDWSKRIWMVLQSVWVHLRF